MLAKLKLYAIGFVGLVTAVFAIFRMGGKSAAAEIQAEASEAAREYENAGYEAAHIGQENERKVKDEDSSSDISRFR